MMFPAFTYPHPIPGAGFQAIHGSDRPECAALAAVAAHLRGDTLLGTAKNLTGPTAAHCLFTALDERGIPEARARAIGQAIGGLKLIHGYDAHKAIPKTLGGLAPSPYQIDAALDLSIAGGLLGMAVGLGKTLTALCAAVAYTRLNFAKRTRLWIFCPLNALGAWRRYEKEMHQYFDDVRVTSIDSAHKLTAADRAAGGVLIIDEAHLAGHQTARRTKALFQIRYGFDACIGLTGTLLHAGVEPALTMLDLVIPGAAGFSTRWRAGETFHCLVKKSIGARTVTELVRPTGDNRAAFLNLMSTYSVMLTKHSESVRSDVTIPEQDLTTITLGDPRESIDDLITRIALANIDPVTRQLPHASAVAHLALAEGADEKIGWVMDEMDDTPVVILAEYHVTLDAARAALDARTIPYSYVDGSVTGEQRINEVEKFQSGKTQVFLGQIDAAGAAIDLFRAHISITLDLTQRATNYAQALGRTCRRGQTHHCVHIDLVANQLQALCLSRLLAAEDFHMSLVNFQKTLDTIKL